MFNPEKIKTQLFQVSSPEEFNDLALEIFYFQAQNCSVYRLYIENLGIDIEKIDDFYKIPFLPINFYKHHKIYSSERDPEIVFSSSGTTSETTSNHYVAEKDLYERSFIEGFYRLYGDPQQYCILALLPSYLEQKSSSLVYMVDHLIKKTNYPDSAFYLYDTGLLIQTFKKLREENQNILFFGVTYALLDLAERFQVDLSGSVIIETGGMKGRKKEMVRQQLHNILCSAFNVDTIQSEYGMTELLSQAYSKGNGLYDPPPWMKILIRDTNDPLELVGNGKTGGINVIDLANIWSCSFIATQDLGITNADGTFEVLGRFDSSDIRGCSLLVV